MECWNQCLLLLSNVHVLNFRSHWKMKNILYCIWKHLLTFLLLTTFLKRFASQSCPHVVLYLSCISLFGSNFFLTACLATLACLCRYIRKLEIWSYEYVLFKVLLRSTQRNVRKDLRGLWESAPCNDAKECLVWNLKRRTVVRISQKDMKSINKWYWVHLGLVSIFDHYFPISSMVNLFISLAKAKIYPDLCKYLKIILK